MFQVSFAYTKLHPNNAKFIARRQSQSHALCFLLDDRAKVSLVALRLRRVCGINTTIVESWFSTAARQWGYIAVTKPVYRLGVQQNPCAEYPNISGRHTAAQAVRADFVAYPPVRGRQRKTSAVASTMRGQLFFPWSACVIRYSTGSWFGLNCT